jgi:hypothetical protein
MVNGEWRRVKYLINKLFFFSEKVLYDKSFRFLFYRKGRKKTKYKYKIYAKLTAICVEGFPQKSFDTNGKIIINAGCNFLNWWAKEAV